MTFTEDNRADDKTNHPAADQLPPGDGIVATSATPSHTPPSKIKMETCLVTGQSMPRDQMVRFVIGPGNVLYPDVDAKLPGTTFWLALGRDILARAVADGVFANADVPADIEEQTASALRRKALEMLSMTRKAGDLITGADKCEQILRSRKGGVYLTAAEENAVTRRKLAHMANRSGAPEIRSFTSDELSTQSGAQNVWHAVIRRGPLCPPFLQTVERVRVFNND